MLNVCERRAVVLVVEFLMMKLPMEKMVVAHFDFFEVVLVMMIVFA